MRALGMGSMTIILTATFSFPSMGQRFLTDIMDTSRAEGQGIYPLNREHDVLKFGGYMHTQYQWIESKGAQTYGGGDFPANTNHRFMLRRGRIRMDYLHFNKDNKLSTAFAFQFDGTERGVNIRDLWGRFYENRFEFFSLTTGVFARPMGFEVNHSSSDRETPERGRMSQILMKTERDLGVMISFAPRKEGSQLKWLSVDLGVFNGQGLAGPYEYDGKKDWIGRLSIKPQTLPGWAGTLGGSISAYRGGIISQTDRIGTMVRAGGRQQMVEQVSSDYVQSVRPRAYTGADLQWKTPNRKGFTELRAEYIRGQQTGTLESSETPGSYPISPLTSRPAPLYTRPFDGAYFYFLQHLGTTRLQFVAKYDWYDPNTEVAGKEIDPSLGFTEADIKYQTISTGFLVHINPHAKAFLFYDFVQNEETRIPGYERDLDDNLLTIRVQFRF